MALTMMVDMGGIIIISPRKKKELSGIKIPPAGDLGGNQESGAAAEA